MLIPPKSASAAVAIIRSLAPHESFLILRRVAHPDDPWSGHFSFPGGRKETRDQDLFATCIRETIEETGVLLEAAQLQQRLPLEPAGLSLTKPTLGGAFSLHHRRSATPQPEPTRDRKCLLAQYPAISKY